jgi:urease accessory protein UreF
MPIMPVSEHLLLNTAEPLYILYIVYSVPSTRLAMAIALVFALAVYVASAALGRDMVIYIYKTAQQFATGLGLRASCQHSAEKARASCQHAAEKACDMILRANSRSTCTASNAACVDAARHAYSRT